MGLKDKIMNWLLSSKDKGQLMDRIGLIALSWFLFLLALLFVYEFNFK